MAREGVRFDTTLDLRTVVHVATLLAAVLTAFFSFQAKVNGVTDDVTKIHRQTTRIEHYLSATDPNYWRKTNENGDSDRR